MPKDEFDFDDPFELNGVAFPTAEDTSVEMAECFTEEFLRMGYNHKQILALFRNPHYLGMNMVLQNKGETFVRRIISETFTRWGLVARWPGTADEANGPIEPTQEGLTGNPVQVRTPDDRGGAALLDPMGGPIPKLE